MGGRQSSDGMRAVRSVFALVLLVALAPRTRAQDVPRQERPIVRAVRVEGNLRFSTEQIVATFGQSVGVPLLEERELRRGIEALFKTFHVRTAVELVPPEAVSEEVELVL